MMLDATYKPDMRHLVTVVALVRELGGDEQAMREAVWRLRSSLPREVQPIASRLMRHEKIELWLDIMLAHFCPEDETYGDV